MKKLMILCSAAAILGLFPANRINAVTQVYDLKTDWSDTQNPNGTWTYLREDLLSQDPFPWAWGDSFGVWEAITKTTEASAVPGSLEVGDIYAITFLNSGVGVRWTAPANGTIDISGAIWNATPDPGNWISWTLTHNGSTLSFGDSLDSPRSAPTDLSAGYLGPDGLLNIRN